jgi:hypothetical protein
LIEWTARLRARRFSFQAPSVTMPHESTRADWRRHSQVL